MAEPLADVFRREAGRCTATLIRVLGDIDLAEDAVAEAFAIAAERWPVTGVPPNPGGWITTIGWTLSLSVMGAACIMNAASSACARSCPGRSIISRDRTPKNPSGTSLGANMVFTAPFSVARLIAAVTV